MQPPFGGEGGVKVGVEEGSGPLPTLGVWWGGGEVRGAVPSMLNNVSTKKHDRITLHLLQEAVEDKNIIPVYIPSDQNVSDMFTKANGRPK